MDFFTGRENSPISSICYFFLIAGLLIWFVNTDCELILNVGFVMCLAGFPHSLIGKESTCNAGALGSIPGLGRSPEEGNGTPPQYSCLENPMGRGAW